ncbi:MAG: iron ABC transporter substrate-binding protein, partial [Candidatus Hydrothermarchaeaceae archaeon]
MKRRTFIKYAGATALSFAGLGCIGREPAVEKAGIEKEKLTVYSGRGEDLVGPIIERFRVDTGI